ncbi:MAG: DUF3084 domain-containing protein [Cyanobacteria bacterium P01_F01_bin.150]
MTTGLFLIAAMLILGGGLATAGDRIGMKVGKARLSLFNMRPRQTATVITILTGGVISATTLGILFLLSEQLRTGVFELKDIQDELADAQVELNQLQNERNEIDQELEEARIKQEESIISLQEVDESLQASLEAQEETEAQLTAKQSELTATQTQLTQADAKFRQTQEELKSVSQQSSALRQELQSLQDAQRQQNETLTKQEEELIEQDAQIFEKTQQLRGLEVQRALLIDELQTLRAGDVALFRNQPLAVGVVKDVTQNVARQTVDQVLRRANQSVLMNILPGTQPIEYQVVLITNQEVEQLIDQLRDGGEYVIRILSAGNYLIGEPCVVSQLRCIQVNAEAVPNSLIFEQNEVIAATPVEASLDSEEKLRDRLELLISATQFRAKQAGVLTDTLQIADGQDSTLREFFDQLIAYQATAQQPFNVAATAASDIYTADPVTVELVALQNGIPTFSTVQAAEPISSQESENETDINETD